MELIYIFILKVLDQKIKYFKHKLDLVMIEWEVF